MKILEIDYDYYYYPQDISCIEDVAKIMSSTSDLIKLETIKSISQ